MREWSFIGCVFLRFFLVSGDLSLSLVNGGVYFIAIRKLTTEGIGLSQGCKFMTKSSAYGDSITAMEGLSWKAGSLVGGFAIQ